MVMVMYYHQVKNKTEYDRKLCKAKEKKMAKDTRRNTVEEGIEMSERSTSQGGKTISPESHLQFSYHPFIYFSFQERKH